MMMTWWEFALAASTLAWLATITATASARRASMRIATRGNGAHRHIRSAEDAARHQ